MSLQEGSFTLKKGNTVTAKEVIAIETVAIFLIILSTMFVMVWTDIVAKNYGSFNAGLVSTILVTALTQTIIFMVGYSLARKLYFYVREIIERNAAFLTTLTKKQLLVIHIFSITALIFAFSRVRPIIQLPSFNSDLSEINSVMVGFSNYNFFVTVCILGVLSLIAIILIHVFNKSTPKQGLILLSLGFVVFAALISSNNYRIQFNTKILEARGYYNMQEEVGWDALRGPKALEYQANTGSKVESLANEALALAKNDEEKALALRWLAGSYTLQRNFDKALTTIQESIKLDPQSYAFGELSYIYIEQKKYVSAIAAAHTCLSRNDTAAYCYAPLAKAQWFMGDYKGSQQTLEKALQYRPDSKLLNMTKKYYPEAETMHRAWYTEDEMAARKNNEPLNACLYDVFEEKHHKWFSEYCVAEGQAPKCTYINSKENAAILTNRVLGEKMSCFEKFSNITY